ncbi:hypothetical protein EXN66_Car004079 [Channa argus]|uniref:Uncharacterized protein n=1 Tax=Channa argus TaxID=215402 RepID=A0A6G1PDU7_CHAAH|nr:hypothetical protein EXN66_Car004079 [Channa argus]
MMDPELRFLEVRHRNAPIYRDHHAFLLTGRSWVVDPVFLAHPSLVFSWHVRVQWIVHRLQLFVFPKEGGGKKHRSSVPSGLCLGLFRVNANPLGNLPYQKNTVPPNLGCSQLSPAGFHPGIRLITFTWCPRCKSVPVRVRPRQEEEAQLCGSGSWNFGLNICKDCLISGLDWEDCCLERKDRVLQRNDWFLDVTLGQRSCQSSNMEVASGSQFFPDIMGAFGPQKYKHKHKETNIPRLGFLYDTYQFASTHLAAGKASWLLICPIVSLHSPLKGF